MISRPVEIPEYLTLKHNHRAVIRLHAEASSLGQMFAFISEQLFMDLTEKIWKLQLRFCCTDLPMFG